MRVLDCVQGSEEWLQNRIGIPTASEFSKLIQSDGKRSKSLSDFAYDLASQLLVREQDETYKGPQMERGNELESDARQAYQESTLNLVSELGFCRLDNPECGYSPDGIVGNDGLIEIKCVNQRSFTKLLRKKEVPKDYVQQIQGGLYITGRKWCDFVAYHPNFKNGKTLFVKRVERDEELIKSLKKHINEVIDKRDEILKEIEYQIIKE